MRGDTDRGIPWLRGNIQAMGPENGFSYHNWWHLALLHLDRNDHAEALSLYDSRVRPVADGKVLMEWIDASALLLPLHLDAVDTAHRFAELAYCCADVTADRYYDFNNLLALIALFGPGRLGRTERQRVG